jgi:superfamily II DNA or RNA helicase
MSVASFRELNLADAYDSGTPGVDVLRDFYVPVLSSAVGYDRLTGYFSSQILALAARGIAGLIANGGSMRLVASPEFTEEDVRAFQSASTVEEVDERLDELFEKAVGDVESLADVIAQNHLRALGWMLKNGKLEIRVLIPKSLDGRRGIFHSKVGVLSDASGDTISFSGSVNETAAGWTHNIEEFKVFRSWDGVSARWVDHDKSQFDRYWAPAGDMGFYARPVPQSVKKKLEDVAPLDISEVDLSIDFFEAGEVSRPELRGYQRDAVDAWVESDMRGLLEMATGTGKTLTATECIRKFQETADRTLTVVTAPYQHIASQWANVLSELDPVSTFGSGSWAAGIADDVSRLGSGFKKHAVWISVQNTAASARFGAFVEQATARVSRSLFVGDEAHGLGAKTFRQSLRPSFDVRLGLSATPHRWFDESGNDVIEEFFGGVVFEFGIHEALQWRDPVTGQTPLTPYDYEPRFVDLDEDEMEEFLSLSTQISLEMARNRDSEKSEKLERLLFRRAAVIKKARQKIELLPTILQDIGNAHDLLIYCHSQEQMTAVMEVCSRHRIKFSRFTGDEGTRPMNEYGGLSEREWILKAFEDKDLDALVAMKCLDEGVDVPSARLGIILASSTNPREFIQRRGRLLRRSPGKEKAVIYDVIVVPNFSAGVQADLRAAARSIIQKELERIEEFSRDASNSEIINARILEKLNEMGFLH